MLMSEEAEVIAKEIDTRLGRHVWSARQVLLGLRAGFRCEYCDLDLLGSPEAYKQWTEDHIVPKFKYLDGDPNEFANLALACRPCNINFKSRWDPSRGGKIQGRGARIAECRRYVAEMRGKAMQELLEFRSMFEVIPKRERE